MNVRAATKFDANAASTIASSVFHMACPPNTPKKDIDLYVKENLSSAAFAEIIERADYSMYIAEVSGKVAGFSIINYDPDDIGIFAANSLSELSRLYVDKTYHGAGIGQILIERSLSSVVGGIRLMVNDQNTRAIGFYRRNGFEEVGEVSFLCGSDVHRDLVMVRRKAL